jgi:hypothetical protein
MSEDQNSGKRLIWGLAMVAVGLGLITSWWGPILGALLITLVLFYFIGQGKK